MSARTMTLLALPLLSAACAMTDTTLRVAYPQDPQPVGSEEPPAAPDATQDPEEQNSDEPESAEIDFTVQAKPRRIKKPTRRAGTQPGRLRQAQTLPAERWTAQFRIEENSGAGSILPGSTGGFFSTAYGVTDRFMVQAQIGDGHQYETVSAATAPGRVFDAAAQYRFLDSERLTVAGRLDVVLADTSAFDPASSSRKVSIQPGILANYSICDGLDFYSSTTLRLNELRLDDEDGALALGFGFLAPVGRVKFFLEADAILQKVEGGKDIFESYLTPGIQFQLRDKIDINVAPSIGLSSTSFDWRFAVTMGVHF